MFASIGRHIGVAIENARLYENLRYYTRQITLAQEEERKRIARELHDDAAQGLIALSRRVDDFAMTSEHLSKADLDRLEEFQDLIVALLQSVRRFSRDLRPSILDDLGLLPAIESSLDELSQHGLSTELQISGHHRRLSPDVELAVFRILQESLNNVRRHAGATHVQVAVEFEQAYLRVTVSDDGCGFDVAGQLNDVTSTGKLGLMGMRERAHLLGGQLTIESQHGLGTVITAEVPAEFRAQ